uniref:hypothetical protein n=1 Tax=Parerythrobacter lutipelagi TaxID=1964208 RepID=UPI0010F67326|nr:hypothetical protein [Parerythrobacter lutipelagi]
MAETRSLDPVVDATALTTLAVSDVMDPLWKLELAGWSAMSFTGGQTRPSRLATVLKHLIASVIAILTLIWLSLRHRGTSASEARALFSEANSVFALHGENSTRTRHLRSALAEAKLASKTVLLLGRPTSGTATAARALDPDNTLGKARFVRPVTLGSVFAGLPEAIRLLARGAGEVSRFRGPIAFRALLAIDFRMALGSAHACWWRKAATGLPVNSALFAHTGTADTSQLEQAMHAQSTRTVHLVHGTNIGWAFAGMSDVAVYPSGADARLGAKLPAYGRCMHLPLERPAVAAGNGDWALLTSYTHLQNPSFAKLGSRPDCELVEWVRAVADSHGQDPARVLWRPHPQIDLVPDNERERLEQAVSEAGFTRWPADLPYAALGEFSVAVSAPSTVLTDGLRLGQPVIIASLTPFQRDALYASHPLLIESVTGLHEAIAQVTNPKLRQEAFVKAWRAIEPGDRLQIGPLLAQI